MTESETSLNIFARDFGPSSFQVSINNFRKLRTVIVLTEISWLLIEPGPLLRTLSKRRLRCPFVYVYYIILKETFHCLFSTAKYYFTEIEKMFDYVKKQMLKT